MPLKRFHREPKKKFGWFGTLLGTLVASNMIWLTVVASLWILFWSSTKFSEIVTQNYLESKARFEKIRDEQAEAIAERDRKIARLIAYQTSSADDVTILAQKIAIILHSASGHKKVFLEKALPEAIRLQVEHGIPASAIISMSILESNYGRSVLAREHHNYFGIKAFSNWKGLRVENMPTRDNGVLTKADFRAYESMGSGFQGYAEFLRNSNRYTRAFNETSGIVFVRTILKAGYCPDSDYDDKILKIMNEHKLDELDVVIRGAENSPYQVAWKKESFEEKLDSEPLPPLKPEEYPIGFTVDESGG